MLAGTHNRGNGTVSAYPRVSSVPSRTSALRGKASVKTVHDRAASAAKDIAGIAAGAQPWILDSSDQLALVRRLERDFSLIEDAGCRVGIGVATGADKAFIGPFDELDVEDDRKLPLAMTHDIISGAVAWRGLGVVNPFADSGGLVDLRGFRR